MKKKIKFRAWTNDHWINKGMVYDYQSTTYVESVGFEDQELILMQYTGLNDRNGKEIYDGDIVKFYANYTNKPCGWQIGFIQINIYELNIIVGDIEYNAGEEADEFPYLKCEVLGNIYENKELLLNK